MEEADLPKRVSELEQAVKALTASQKTDTERSGLAARGQSFAKLLIANWVLVSFVSALLVAGYVKYRFGIDYFENYRNVATTKQLSKFYEQMGDRMMAKSEWQAAEQAYRAALQVNPNNTAATFGIVKAQVFQPLPGEKFVAPEVVDARLEYLLSRFPDDYQIYFLKAVRYQLMEKNEEAMQWLHKCIDKNPQFTGCYLQLGMLDYGQSRVAEAEANFAKVVELDPNSAAAKNDLAACHVLQSDFSGAVRQFEESYRISPSAVTAVSLGEAYWYLRNFNAALGIHQVAADYMNKNSDLQDRYNGGEWTSGFLPLRVGDRETIKISVPIYTLEQKKTILHFELAMDQALLGRFDAANQEFAVAWKLAPPLGHRQLIQNRMQSVENLVQMPEASKSWLAEHRKMLD